MADDEPRKTTRREHILSFIRSAPRKADALRLFDMLDKSAPPKSAPPPAANTRNSERKK